MKISKDVEVTLAEIKEEFPSFKIIPKSESKLMKFLNRVLLILSFGKNKNFMTGFITTIYTTVYTTDTWESKSPESRISTLRHERVHMRQAKKHSFPIFLLLYFVLPFPVVFAYGRARLEWEAYTESMRVTAYFNGIDFLKTSDSYRAHIVGHFTGPGYIWMYPFSSVINKWYDKAVVEIEEELKEKE